MNNLTNEDIIWMPVRGWENLYEVNNYGIIRSLNREINCNGGSRFIKGKYLKNKMGNAGYLMVYLSNGKIRKNCLVHRLVAIAFINNPNNYPQINHKSGNKQDNRVEMLEWCTSSYNNKYSFVYLGRKGTKSFKGRTGKNHPSSICIKQYDLNNNLLNKYESISEAAKQTGTGLSNIAACIKNGTNKTNGFIWKRD